MTVHITNHAVDRYIERVAPVSRAEAARVMLAAERVITCGAAFGARVVRLASGARLIFRGTRPAVGEDGAATRTHIRVVTVLGRGCIEGGHSAKLLKPLCCAACSLRCSHPLTRACTRTDCSLARDSRGSA